jgi:hypothetical protein
MIKNNKKEMDGTNKTCIVKKMGQLYTRQISFSKVKFINIFIDFHNYLYLLSDKRERYVYENGYVVLNKENNFM